eukprot:378340_1
MGGYLLMVMFIVVTKSHNITCDSVNENTNTCYINIPYHYFESPSAECNSNYHNCVINTLSRARNWNLHCPSGNCISCIVNGLDASRFNIYGYDCSLLKIDGSSNRDGVITAPGNGGTLILQSQVLDEVKIYSVNGTQNMIINIHLDDDWTLGLARLGSNIYIDASYVQGYLNYTISGMMNAYQTQIICGKQCNINCTSQRQSRGCSDMMVSGINGISSINWHCLKDESQCIDSI